jgi:hypothetical protein
MLQLHVQNMVIFNKEHNHLMGQGCPKCAKIASKIKETIRAQTKHNFF